jgi:O-antigen ligase
MVEKGQVLGDGRIKEKGAPLSGAFFWLSAFYVVYCARPEDWIPGLSYIPLAKISGIFAILGLATSVGKTKRSFKDLPKEARYLLAMIAIMFVSALLSPVWKGGAFLHTVDFAKVYVAWVLTFILVTNFARLKRLIFIQSASVAMITLISVVKGHNTPRLEGVLGGIYGNPNDLAFAIVLSLPFCLAFLLAAKGVLRKMAWMAAMLMMAVALFLTASRAGFIDLIAAGTVSLWFFGVRGKRPQLIASALLAAALVGALAGGHLKDRFFAISGDVNSSMEQKAYGSFEERRYVMGKAVEAMEHYPVLGVGLHNFVVYSGIWKEVHMTYLQIGAEGGIPILILYLMFFYRGFSNLRVLKKKPDLEPESRLLVGALYGSLIGFVVGACFAPEAYQFFPYFAVGYSAVLLAIVNEERPVVSPSRGYMRHRELYANHGRPDVLTPAR